MSHLVSEEQSRKLPPSVVGVISCKGNSGTEDFFGLGKSADSMECRKGEAEEEIEDYSISEG